MQYAKCVINTSKVIFLKQIISLYSSCILPVMILKAKIEKEKELTRQI